MSTDELRTQRRKRQRTTTLGDRLATVTLVVVLVAFWSALIVGTIALWRWVA